MKPRPRKTWDGLWRILVFDIPNDKKNARDALAATLKRLDFVPLQKSVFVSPHPCEDELEIIADYFGVSDNVHVIVATGVSQDKEIRRIFGLKNE